MRILLLLLLSFNLHAQKTDLFEYSKGKVLISRTYPINKNLGYTVKSKLGIYANNYNGGIFQEANKMKDYITYEDTSLIAAVIKFHTVQTMQDAIWQGEAEFQKIGDSVNVTLKGIKVEKVANIFIGDVAVNTRQTNPLAPEQCDPLSNLSKNGLIEA